MDRQKNNKIFLLSLLVPVTLGLVACQGFEAATEFQSTLEGVSRSDKFDITERPQCEVDFADYEIDAHLLAFQIQDKMNISFGFNLFEGFFKALGISIKAKKGKMLVSMHLEETLRPSVSVADVLGEGVSKENEFNIDLNAAQLGVEFGYYYKTPLFKLTEKTLVSALTNLRADLSKVDTKWNSKIVWRDGNYEFIVPSGSVAGLREGDQLAIYNTEYVWRAEPCISELLMVKKTTDTPMAIAQVVQVEKNASLIRVVQSFSDEDIWIGARVEPHLLPAGKDETRVLSRSARVVNIASEPLTVEGAKDVDLTVYLREQLEALLNNYGMYARK